MELSEFQGKVSALELELTQYLYEKIEKLRAETGYAPSDIYVRLMKYEEIGAKPAHMVDGVQLKFDLFV